MHTVKKTAIHRSSGTNCTVRKRAKPSHFQIILPVQEFEKALHNMISHENAYLVHNPM